jgi:hypothetical protein
LMCLKAPNSHSNLSSHAYLMNKVVKPLHHLSTLIKRTMMITQLSTPWSTTWRFSASTVC